MASHPQHTATLPFPIVLSSEPMEMLWGIRPRRINGIIIIISIFVIANIRRMARTEP